MTGPFGGWLLSVRWRLIIWLAGRATVLVNVVFPAPVVISGRYQDADFTLAHGCEFSGGMEFVEALPAVEATP